MELLKVFQSFSLELCNKENKKHIYHDPAMGSFAGAFTALAFNTAQRSETVSKWCNHMTDLYK